MDDSPTGFSAPSRAKTPDVVSGFAHFPLQPGLGRGPVGLRSRLRNTQQASDLGQGQASKVPQFDQLGPAGAGGLQLLQGLVEGQEVERVRVKVGDRLIPVEVLTPETAPVPQAAIAAGAVDEDAAHGLGGGEEVTAAVELLVADEPQVRLVDERGRVERLTGL